MLTPTVANGSNSFPSKSQVPIPHLQLAVCLSSPCLCLEMAVSEDANSQQERGRQGASSVSSSFSAWPFD